MFITSGQLRNTREMIEIGRYKSTSCDMDHEVHHFDLSMHRVENLLGFERTVGNIVGIVHMCLLFLTS